MRVALNTNILAYAEGIVFISENLQNGFTWRGVTVVDPFAHPRAALLDSILIGPGRPLGEAAS